jgi:transcriptional regulator with XRE-family HTH domain
MNYVLQPIAEQLKQAREHKGLSQRALSKLAGVPQSHISKIENVGVDLRVSSLIELARVLDLELTLVPRKSVSAVRAVTRSGEPSSPPDESDRRLYNTWQKHLREALEAVPGNTELAQVQRLVRDFQHLRLSKTHRDELREAMRVVKGFDGSRTDQLEGTVRQLSRMRNELVHGSFEKGTRVRPAYSLEEDEDG